MNKFTAPTIARINSERQYFACEPKLIRAIWKAENLDKLRELCPEVVDIERRYHCAPGLRELKRQALNHCGEFSGVEYLGFNRRIGEQVYYLNSGDSYVTTLIFQGDKMSLGNWGYMVERGDIIGNQL